MANKRTTVILGNLGTPAEPSAAAVRRFLEPFLSDPRVVEIPRPVWWLILNLFILPFRPKAVAEAYQTLWNEYGDSPLRLFTQSQVSKLQEKLGDEFQVDYAFAYGSPTLAEKIEQYRDTSERIIVLPLYPQYSCSTTAAFYDQLASYQTAKRNVADVYIVKDYYQEPTFRQALKKSVEAFWQQHGRGDYLLMSYHGVPKAYADKGDPYYQQCLKTSENLVHDLQLNEGEYSSSFQSRLGKAEWLTPYTDVTVKALAAKGIKTLDVICPSFSVDCLETLEEITIENGAYFTQAGGVKLRLIPCLNDSEDHIAMMQTIVSRLFVSKVEAQQA
jgi:ferrochelatase